VVRLNIICGKIRLLLAVVLLLLTIPLPLLTLTFSQAAGPNLTGHVYDAKLKTPMSGVTVKVVYGEYRGTQTATTLTDATGFFSFDIPWDDWVTIYVFKDDPATPGVDYVPATSRVYVQRSGTSSYDFNLTAGASIFLKSEIVSQEGAQARLGVRFVESAKPTIDNRFIVCPLGSAVEPPSLGSPVEPYGAPELEIIGLNAPRGRPRGHRSSDQRLGYFEAGPLL